MVFAGEKSIRVGWKRFWVPVALLAAMFAASHAADLDVTLPAGPGPITNALKGYAPYDGDAHVAGVPFSMAYYEASWRELEPRPGQYAFDAWEKRTLQSDFAKNRHVVLRVWMDYPNQPTGVPQWLLDQGLKMTPYTDHGGGKSPDYADPRLRQGLKRLIAAMGQRWNKNPQVAFIQVGLLGFWGEWHTWPRTELFAPPEVQREVIQGMRAAFPDKQIMARNATEPVTQLPWIGYHDDMIPDDTLGPEEWKFLPMLRIAKRDQNWRVAPTGGEMVPGKARLYLGDEWPQTQRAVSDAHFSWIGPYGPTMARTDDPQFIERARKLSQSLGYQFALKRLQVRDGQISLSAENQGVAPFYYPWRVQFALLDSEGKPVAVASSSADIRRWQPGALTVSASMPRPARSGERLAIGIIDPWTGRPAIQFANQLETVNGWTVLAHFP